MSKVIKNDRIIYDDNPIEIRIFEPHARVIKKDGSGEDKEDVTKILSRNAVESAEISVAAALKEASAIKERGKVETRFAFSNGTNDGKRQGNIDGEKKGKLDGENGSQQLFQNAFQKTVDTIKQLDNQTLLDISSAKSDCVDFAFDLAENILGIPVDRSKQKYKALADEFLSSKPDDLTLTVEGIQKNFKTLQTGAILNAADGLQGILAYVENVKAISEKSKAISEKSKDISEKSKDISEKAKTVFEDSDDSDKSNDSSNEVLEKEVSETKAVEETEKEIPKEQEQLPIESKVEAPDLIDIKPAQEVKENKEPDEKNESLNSDQVENSKDSEDNESFISLADELTAEDEAAASNAPKDSTDSQKNVEKEEPEKLLEPQEPQEVEERVEQEKADDTQKLEQPQEFQEENLEDQEEVEEEEAQEIEEVEEQPELQEEPTDANEKFVFIKPITKKSRIASMDDADQFAIEDIAAFPQSDLKTILKKLEPREIAAALQSESLEAKEAILSALTRKNRSKTEEAIKFLGPFSDDEVKKAKNDLIELAAQI